MLQLRHDDGAGYGIPLAGGQVLTVEHLTHGQLFYIAPNHKSGPLTLTWADEEQDLAMLQSTQPFASTIKISDKPAEVGSKVYYRIMLDTIDAVSWTWGTVLGTDSSGDLLINGWVAPGASGSGILNELGELVGIVQAGENFSARPPKDGLGDVVNMPRLFTRTSFSPLPSCASYL